MSTRKNFPNRKKARQREALARHSGVNTSIHIEEESI